MKHVIFIPIILLLLSVLFFSVFSCQTDSGDDDADSRGNSNPTDDDNDDSQPDDDDDDDDNDSDDDDDDDTGETAPDAPSDLIAEVFGSERIDISWQDNSENELGFTIQRANAGDDRTWAAIGSVGRDITTYSDESVACENSYQYRVSAYNDSGDSPFSNEADALTGYCEISPPTDLTAIQVSDVQIDIGWTDHSFNETKFEIQRRIFGATNWTDIAQAGADAETFSDIDAGCETTYQYRVRAANDNAASDFSNTATATAGTCLLEAPTNLIATAGLVEQVDLTWEDNANEETGYLVQRRPFESRGWETIADLPLDTVSYTDEEVLCETGQYEYQVRAYNAETISHWSSPATGGAFCGVEAPTNLVLSIVGGNVIHLAWTNNADNHTGFKIYRGGETLEYLDQTASDVIIYDDPDVDCVLTFRYSVTAFNDNVESPPCAVQTVWCPVAAPSNVSAGSTSSTAISISWHDNSDNENGFRVYYKKEGTTTWNLLANQPANSTSYNHSTAKCFESYRYKVMAYNDHMNSPYSSASGIASVNNFCEDCDCWKACAHGVQNFAYNCAVAAINCVNGLTQYDEDGLDACMAQWEICYGNNLTTYATNCFGACDVTYTWEVYAQCPGVDLDCIDACYETSSTCFDDCDYDKGWADTNLCLMNCDKAASTCNNSCID